MVVSKYFKHNRLSLDVVDERFGNFHSNLEKKIKKQSSFAAWPFTSGMICMGSPHILHVVEAKRRSTTGVFQGLGGEGLIVAVDETETDRAEPCTDKPPRTIVSCSDLLSDAYLN